MAAKCTLTTIDNSYNPLEQFASCFLFDEEKGYHFLRQKNIFFYEEKRILLYSDSC